MKKHRARRSSSPTAFIEKMEDRRLLSGTIATTTTISAPTSELLGQQFTVTVNVAASDSSAITGGTVSLLNNGVATGMTANVDNSGNATFTVGAGNALYAGTYNIGAQFSGNGSDAASAATTPSTLVISLPTFSTQPDGLQIATVTPGNGPAAVNGQPLTVLYTGFYQSDGSEFDESSAHSPGTFTFTLNASPEQVIPGFDEGSTGITPGETRVLVIPSALGYMDGKTRIFVIQDAATPQTPTQLTINAQPQSATVGQAITTPLVVNVADANGAVVAGDGSTVTVSIASGPAGGTLGGTTSVAAQGGQATFGDLTFSTVGTYTLTASDGSLTSVTTSPITVSPIPQSSVAPSLGNVTVASAAVAGGQLGAKVPVILSNSGGLLKGRVTVNLYANTSTTLDGNQILIGSQQKNLTLKTARAKLVNLKVKSLPSTVPNGTYYLLAQVVDPTGATNLVASTQTVTVAAPFVQPTAAVISVTPASLAPGKAGTVVVTLTNNGNVAGHSLTLTVSPSSDGVTPVAGVILDTLQRNVKIAPSATKTFRLRFKVPADASAGVFFPYISATLDGAATTAVGATSFTVT